MYIPSVATTKWQRSLWKRVAPLGVLLLIAFALGATVWIVLPRLQKRLLLTDSDWTTTGEVAPDGVYPSDESELRVLRMKGVMRWGTWTGDDSHTGTVASAFFAAPSRVSLFVAGYPNAPGNALYIEKQENGDHCSVTILNPEENWTLATVRLPMDWVGKPVRLVARDGSVGFRGWLGLSAPFQGDWFTGFLWPLLVIVALPLFAIQYFFFLAPGLWAAIKLGRRWNISNPSLVILAVSLSTLAGYGVFWVYFANHLAGRFASIMFLLASLYGLFRRKTRSDIIQAVAHPDVSSPMLLMFLAGLFYLSLLYTVDPGRSAEMQARTRFSHELPLDNVLPQLFAEHLFRGSDPRALFLDWHSSDRPPLQTGATLLLRPISRLFQAGLHYEILGLILQSSWVAGVWALLRLLRVRYRSVAFAIALITLSGFSLVNSVFVWPKMLAAALAIYSVSFVLAAIVKKKDLSRIDAILAGGAAALAVLSHAGVSFTFIPLALFLLFFRGRAWFSSLALGALTFAILLLPWSAYQRFYDPPGNRLLKLHLAGVADLDNRSTWQALKDQYGAMSLLEVADHKWANAKVLFGTSPVELPGFSQAKRQSARINDFFWFFRSLGILNLGWFVLPLAFIWRVWFPDRAALTPATLLLALGLASVLVWILLMFGPGTTLIHQGSYATLLLLFAAMGILLAESNRVVSWLVLLWQAVGFAMIYVPAMPVDGTANWPMVGCTLVFFLIWASFICTLARADFVAA